LEVQRLKKFNGSTVITAKPGTVNLEPLCLEPLNREPLLDR
jgi:hypothetical protein